MGADRGICRVWWDFYQNMEMTLQYDSDMTGWRRSRPKLIQGCPLSPLALSALMCAWLLGVRDMGGPSSMASCIFCDDRVH